MALTLPVNSSGKWAKRRGCYWATLVRIRVTGAQDVYLPWQPITRRSVITDWIKSFICFCPFCQLLSSGALLTLPFWHCPTRPDFCSNKRVNVWICLSWSSNKIPGIDILVFLHMFYDSHICECIVRVSVYIHIQLNHIPICFLMRLWQTVSLQVTTCF